MEQLVLPYSESKALTLRRSADNGGDQVFCSATELSAAFAAGSVHPGDLKPAVRDAVEEVMSRVRAAIKADKELADAEKELQKVIKRANKK